MSSIVNAWGQQVSPVAPARASRPVKSPKIRRRNRQWLTTQRRLGLSGRELAAFLNKPHRTVAAGILWAIEHDEDNSERSPSADTSPVVDRASGLTENDVLYLLDTYGPDTELGSCPEFWQVLGPLVDKILGPLSSASPAIVAAAA